MHRLSFFMEKGSVAMKTVVVKVGVSAMQSEERIEQAAQYIEALKEQGNRVVVVASGMAKEKSTLLAPIAKWTANALQREQAMLMATSSQISASSLAVALQARGHASTALTAQQAGVKTDAKYQHARITAIQTTKIETLLAQGSIVTIAGRQGVANGELTYLGDGGSATLAVALAHYLQATHVIVLAKDSIYTADQAIIPRAQRMAEISFDEMLEFAHLGANLLHPRSVELAKKYNVKIFIQALTEQHGTWVKGEKDMEKEMIVRGVAYEADIVRLTVGYDSNQEVSLASLFTTLAKHHINVDIIVQATMHQAAQTVSFSIEKTQFAEALKVLEDNKQQLGFTFADFEIGLAKVSIIGSAMASNPGVAASMFDRLRKEKIAVKMVSTSEIKVSVVVPQEDMVRAAQALHDEYHL